MLASIELEIDAMILNTKYDDEVGGAVVGRYQIICSLRYAGRKQGSTFYAETEDEARRVAEDRKNEIILRCGVAAHDIFPLDSWELRIHAC